MSRIRLTDGVCIVCEIETEGFGSHRSFCSPRCQSEYIEYPNGRPKGVDCIMCGEFIDFSVVRPGGRRVRVDTKKCFTCRRDQRYPVTAHDLAMRDGTDCSICREPVDMSLKWPDRWMPTIDHVYPWSLGGSNDVSNLALAHFRCNIQKRNKVLAAV